MGRQAQVRRQRQESRGNAHLPPWTPFERAKAVPRAGFNKSHLIAMLVRRGVDLPNAIAIINRQLEQEIYVNSRYTVIVTRGQQFPYANAPVCTHLSIRRNDRQRIGAERYRDFMRIKGELLGEQHEGVELYPARSREVDMADQYHLWVLEDPGQGWPVGFAAGMVDYEAHPGEPAVQTPPEG